MKSAPLALLIAIQFLTIAHGQDKPAPTQAAPAAAEKASQPPAPVDYSYAWDQFKHLGTMMWGCRGVQSGASVGRDLCAFAPMVDSQWPDKNISADWKP
ncbi:hypothetical protein AB2N08_12090 [Massilia aurea]|uniref:hypothetical protein n=1 Tax=Massilia aurea TaxID=373040 RepID=UPI00346362D3